MKPLRNPFFPQVLVVCFAPALALFAPQVNAEGLFSTGVLTGDANSGVSTSKSYTALANVVGGNVVVNGATFAAGTTNTTGAGWSLTGIGSTFGTGGNKTTTFGSSNIDELFAGFMYNGKPGAITLDNLTVGKTYVTTLYCENFSWPIATNRWIRMKGAEGGVLPFNEDAVEASMLRYTFVASATSMAINPVAMSADTFHVYGLSNEDVFNKTWTSGADWTTATWGPTGAPNGIGTSASFGSQGAPSTINLDASQTVGHVQFNGTSAWTLSSSNGSVFTLQTDDGGLSVISTPAGSHVISTPVVFASEVMKNGPGTLTLNGVASGTKGITVTGGILKLGVPQTYTGTTTLNAGTVLDVNDTAQTIASLAGAGTVLNNGSGSRVLTVNSGKFSGVITDHSTGTGTLSLTKGGSGIFTITAPQTYTGPTVVANGTLRLEGSGGAMFTDNFNETGTTPDNQNLNYNLSARQGGSAAPQNWTKTGNPNAQVGNNTNVQQPTSVSGEYMLMSGATCTLQGMPLNDTNVTGPLKISFDMFKGALAGDLTNWTAFALRNATGMQPNTVGPGEIGFLYRKNSGLQLFSGSGAAIVDIPSTTAGDDFAFYIADNNGTGSAFGTNGSRLVVTQGGGVIADVKLATAMTNRLINFGMSATITGGVDTLAVTPLQSNLLPADTHLSLTSATSVFQLENLSQAVTHVEGVPGSTISIGPFSRLVLNSSSGTNFAGNITGTRGGITKLGSDTLTLTGNNSFTGELTVTDGSVIASGGSALPDGGSVNLSDAPGVQLTITSNETMGSLLGGGDNSGQVEIGANTLTMGADNGSATFSGYISGSGPIVKTGTGTQILVGTNTYGGSTTISGGTLQLGDGGFSGSIPVTSAIINNGNLAINRDGTLTQGVDFGPISGTGSFVQAGFGTTILNAGSSYTGHTAVTAGILTIANNSANTFSNTSAVSISGLGTLDLPNAATDIVGSLLINGVALPDGIYDASSLETAGYIIGQGKLQVGVVITGYQGWANTNVGGAAASVDTDLDGVLNGVEYFMNAPAGFTANPPVVTSGGVKTVTYPNGGNVPSTDYGTQFVIQTSTNLTTWTTVLSSDPNLANTPGSVAYTLPAGPDKTFVRLQVVPN